MNKYDVIVVGAGIGGLVCGSLLAKKGRKVLILEKNSNVGGYCSSFTVKEFRFDAFVHSFGNLSKGSQLNILLEDLGVLDNLQLVRINPSDIIISPDCRIEFRDNIDETVENFVLSFPHEKNAIYSFFKDYLMYEELDSIQEFRNKTFGDFLNKVFKDTKLKQILSLVILGNLGTPPQEISSFTAMKHYRQFMVDGGYYTEGGVDAIPNALADKFSVFSGEMMLSKPVNRILVDSDGACGVETKDGQTFYSKYVVSACDMRTTFFDLVGKASLEKSNVEFLDSLKPSLSLIVVYLGLRNIPSDLSDRVNNWFIRDYEFDKNLKLNKDYVFENVPWFMIRVNHSEKTCVIYASAPTKDVGYWRNNRNAIAEDVLNIVDVYVPKLKENIVFRTVADPSVLNKWTSNFSGAAYGWASTLDQFMIHEFLRDRTIPGLFLCGHWSTVGQGVPGVAIAAQRVANIIGDRLDKEIK